MCNCSNREYSRVPHQKLEAAEKERGTELCAALKCNCRVAGGDKGAEQQ